MTKPTQEHIPEILDNGIIGLQDQIGDLNENLVEINTKLQAISNELHEINRNLVQLRND